MGSKEVYQIDDIERVSANLGLVEETNDGETELTARMALNIYVKGKVEPLELCNPACYYTKDQVQEIIKFLQQNESVVFEANKLKQFERDFIENNKSYLLDIHGLVEGNQPSP